MLGLVFVYVFVGVSVGLYFSLAGQKDLETSFKAGLVWPVTLIKVLFRDS